MKENKFEIKVIFSNEVANFSVARNSTVAKLIKIIEIYYEDLQGSEYEVLWKEDKNLKDLDRDLILSDAFKIKDVEANKTFIELGIELTVNIRNKLLKCLEFECLFKNEKKNFKISKNFNFLNLKINILALYPELELENYSLIYFEKDITNYYEQSKPLDFIFLDSISRNETIKLKLLTKQKNFVEFHKKCKICEKAKATKICIKCATSYCELCCTTDPHISKNSNFILVKDFKNFEKEKTSYLLDSFNEFNSKNLKLCSKRFTKMTEEKISAIEKKHEDIIELANTIRNIQLSNLKSSIDVIKKESQPEAISEKIQNISSLILSYVNNPFIDIEESSKKIIEFEDELDNFKSDFFHYETLLAEFTGKYINSLAIDNNIFEYLKNNLIELKHLYKRKDKKKEKFKPLLKIYDNKSVLVYDHNIEEFSLMNFIDIDGKFKENLNNYVQYNYTKYNKLFIITGNPSQNLFCYDYTSNEMEFIASMKYNHNWWPILLVLDNINEDRLSQVNIFCLSGSYSKKCEKLNFSTRKNNTIANGAKEISMEWIELPDTNSEHGQASSFTVDQSVIYILFGYDYNINSISIIERLDMKTSSRWENISFKNPDNISSILYYHSNLKIDDNSIYIVGGLKEINQGDFVYKLEISGNEENTILNKTNFNFNLDNTKFCYEKLFVNLLHEDEEETKYFGLDRIDINIDDSLNINSKGLSDLTKNLQHEPSSNIIEESTFAIFDSKNNVHLIKPKSFEYKLKQYNI